MAIENKPYIGQLDRRINIFKIIVVKDKIGAEKSSREKFSSPWSKLSNDMGSEEIDMAVMNSTMRTYIIRYRSEIEKYGTKMLLEDQGVVFNIISVSPLGRKQYLIIKCVNEQ